MPSHCIHDCACACKSPSESLSDLIDELRELKDIIRELKSENRQLKSDKKALKDAIRIIRGNE